MRMQRTVTGNVKIKVFFLQILKMILKRMIAMLCIASDIYYGAVKAIEPTRFNRSERAEHHDHKIDANRANLRKN